MKVISPASLVRRGPDDESIILVDGESFAADFDRESIRKLFPETDAQLFLMDANQLMSHYGKEAIRDIETHISHLVRDGGACICFTWPDSNPVDMDMGMSENHLKAETRGSAVLLYGIKPNTPVHVLAPDMNNGGRMAPRPML
jgi:hypothetical protein